MHDGASRVRVESQVFDHNYFFFSASIVIYDMRYVAGAILW